VARRAQVPQDEFPALRRWRRQGLILTQAVFNMDDDTTVDLGTLEFGFGIWKKHPDQVIGFFDRCIYLNGTEYVYGYDAGELVPSSRHARPEPP